MWVIKKIWILKRQSRKGKDTQRLGKKKQSKANGKELFLSTNIFKNVDIVCFATMMKWNHAWWMMNDRIKLCYVELLQKGETEDVLMEWI